MITRNEAKNIIVSLINSAFAGYTVATHDIKPFANSVLEAAMNGHVHTSEAKIRATFSAMVIEEFGIRA